VVCSHLIRISYYKNNKSGQILCKNTQVYIYFIQCNLHVRIQLQNSYTDNRACTKRLSCNSGSNSFIGLFKMLILEETALYHVIPSRRPHTSGNTGQQIKKKLYL